MRVADTLAFVRGHWRVERSLTDYRAAAAGSLTGTASFLPLPGEPAGLEYREQGELQLDGYRGQASRSLLWLPAADGTAAVRFRDGRAFHLADLRTGRWQADHRCGEDVYHVSYHVHGHGLLAETWRAYGPRKDYLITTFLFRTLSAEPTGH